MTDHVKALRDIAENLHGRRDDHNGKPLEVLRVTWDGPEHIVIVTTRGAYETLDAGYNWCPIPGRIQCNPLSGGMHPK